jgi:hypothetical protein
MARYNGQKNGNMGQDASKLLLDEIEFFALNLSIHVQQF